MEDEYNFEDPTLIHTEALCNLVELYERTSNRELRARLLIAIDAVILKLGPSSLPRGGALIDVTGHHG